MAAPTPIVPIVEAVPLAVNPAAEDEQAKKSAGQRHINEKWESTQQWTAILVTASAMVACIIMIVAGISYGKTELTIPAFLFMCNVATQVLTSYFTRTNHTKTGGVGGTDSR